MASVRAVSTLLLATGPLVLAGCSHLPPAEVSYYVPETTVKVKVVRTLACDAAGKLITANAATPTVTHSADRAHGTRTFDLKPFADYFKDADVKFEFFSDGRLKSLNSTSQGQGEAVLNSVIKIASATAVLVAKMAPSTEIPPKSSVDPCAVIKDAAKDKPLSLIYEGDFVADHALTPAKPPADSEKDAKPARAYYPIPVKASSKVYAEKLAPGLQRVCASLLKLPTPPLPVTSKGEIKAHLPARQPGLATLTIYASWGDCTVPATGDEQIWSGEVPIAQFGTDYDILIPVSGIFGKQVTQIVFAESGALGTLQYATAPGASQPLGLISTGLAEFQGQTAARAAQTKADADLIAEQQRLVRCQRDPSTCTTE
jgi:hypothetical protein